MTWWESRVRVCVCVCVCFCFFFFLCVCVCFDFGNAERSCTPQDLQSIIAKHHGRAGTLLQGLINSADFLSSIRRFTIAGPRKMRKQAHDCIEQSLHGNSCTTPPTLPRKKLLLPGGHGISVLAGQGEADTTRVFSGMRRFRSLPCSSLKGKVSALVKLLRKPLLSWWREAHLRYC